MDPKRLFAACALAAALCLQARAQTAQSSAAAQAGNGGQAQPSAPAQQAVPPLQLHDLPPDPHTPTRAELAQEQQQRILAAATRVAVEQARWGPEISSPGLSISLKETARAKTPAGTEITYQITGTGFAPTDRLSLVRWPLNTQAETLMGGIGFDANGVAVCAPPAPAGTANLSAAPAPTDVPAAPPATPCTSTMKQDQPVEIRATAAPGEAIRVALIGRDRRHGAAASAVPFPIASQDKACRLQILLGMKDAEMVLVEGTGFPPDTSMKIDATSWGTVHQLNTKSNPEGKFVFMLLTGVQGHDAGDTTVKFDGITHAPSLEDSKNPPPADPDCSPAVTFHWGKGSYKAE